MKIILAIYVFKIGLFEDNNSREIDLWNIFLSVTNEYAIVLIILLHVEWRNNNFYFNHDRIN